MIKILLFYFLIFYLDGTKYVGEFKNGRAWNGTHYDKEGNILVKFVNGIKQ